MSKVIYIESEILFENKTAMEWLNGCGLKWVDNTPFNSYRSKRLFLKFKEGNFYEAPFIEDKSYILTFTAFQFCQEMAKTLGFPEPEFKDADIVDSNLKQDFVNSVETQDNIESQVSSEPETKGLAIDASLLGEYDRNWIANLNDYASTFLNNAIKYKCFIGFGDGLGWGRKEFYINKANWYVITDNPLEFMRYVSQRTGKEYRALSDSKLSASMIQAILETEPLFIDNTNTMKIDAKDDQKITDYPHRNYCILESLDSVPLDTRMPVSKQIPPFNADVLFLHENHKFFGRFGKINSSGIIAVSEDNTEVNVSDYHWMRIV